MDDVVATERELLKTLIDSNEWEELKTNIQQINVDVDERGYMKNVESTIRYLLLNKDNFPSEILTLLIDKKITGIRHPEHDFDDFYEQIYYDICCLHYPDTDDDEDLPNSVTGRITLFNNQVSLPVFDMILKEHTRLVEMSYFSYRRCEWRFRIDVIEVMWEHYLKCVGWIDGRGREDLEDQLLEINSIDFESDADLFHLWERTIRIMEYRRQDDLPLLHYIVKEGCRPIFVWFLCKLQPNQLQERDNTGRIPLHYSITKPVIGGYSRRCLDDIWKNISKKLSISFYDGDIHRDALTCTSMLLHFFKTGARYADSDGKLPLTYLLERGSWTGYDYYGNGDMMLYRTHREDAKLLIDASPKEALTTRDVSSGLFPFMIQSQEYLEHFDDSDDSDESDCDRKEIEEMNLTVSYEILQQDPSVLLHIIDLDQPLGSSYEQRLKRQCDEEKEKNAKLERRENNNVKLEKKILELEKKLSSKEKEIERLRKLLRQNNVVFDDKIGNNTDDDDDDDGSA